MTRTKLYRYQNLASYPNTHEGLGKVPLEKLFAKSQSLTLELACGRGEYTNGLAAIYPDQNYLGIDVKGERLWQAARVSQEQGLENTAFARTPIDLLEKALPPKSVEAIWLVHPDPQPKRPRQRLTNLKYLEKYARTLRPGGEFHLKTDDADFFTYSLKTLPTLFEIQESTTNLHNSPLLEKHRGITTNFEQKALAQGRTIKYLQAACKEF